MTASTVSAFAESKPVSAAGLIWFALWLLWQSVRLPLFLLLAILEPVVSFVLGALALLGVLTALFWEAIHPAHFPHAIYRLRRRRVASHKSVAMTVNARHRIAAIMDQRLTIAF